MKNIIKILSFTLALTFILCSCKNTEKDAESSKAEYISESLISSNASENDNNSSKNELDSSKATATDKNEPEVSQQSSSSNNSDDPQISGKATEIGAEVEAETLEVKEGKANGIDVSKWQGRIDWKAVKNTGVDFAVIRIGYRGENGKIFKDDCADYNIQQAVKNNILVGVYFFSTAISQSEAIEEAKWTANAIKSYPISYPVVYDCEGYLNTDSRMYNLSNSQRTDNALAFLSEIEKSGYDGMFYAAATEMENSLRWDAERIENTYKIWVAHYPAVTYPKVSNPEYSGEYHMWQYTNMGKVKGINGNADMVVSYFTVKKAEPKSNQAAPEAKVPEIKDEIYTSISDTVTAKDTVNLRDSASTNGKIVGKLKNGETLKRTATGTNGWSKLLYNGKTVYAVTSYLTTDLSYKPPVEDDGFTATNEKVTAKDSTNLRTVPDSSDSTTIAYTLKNGDVAVRIGVSNSGWSKLSYKGKTLYAVTSYLTTDLNYKTPTADNTESESGLKTQFTDVNEQVTAKSETNLRSLPSVTGSEIIHTLKNGEYVTRTGMSTNGWSRLEYNGQTVYAVSSYLTK